jgi:YD repeat-containing protein
MIEQHTLTYIASGIYLNGNRASDVFQLKGPDAAAACYAATCTASWTYDARDRLSQEVNGSGTTTTFTLDIVGNVTSEAPSGGTTITRTYSGQQLATQSSGGTTTKFLYDALGNQDCKVKSTFAGNSCPATGSDLLEDWVYDYKNRLTAYTSYDGSGNLVNSVSYTNDPLDRPVQQTSTESGSTTNYELSYLGASDQLSKEVLTGATATTKKYAYEPDRVSRGPSSQDVVLGRGDPPLSCRDRGSTPRSCSSVVCGWRSRVAVRSRMLPPISGSIPRRCASGCARRRPTRA